MNQKKLLIDIENTKLKESFIIQYFSSFLYLGRKSYIKALETFAKQGSYIISDYEALFFQESFDEWEQEYDLLEGRKVAISIDPPAYEEEVFLVMSFEEFYGHLVDTAKLVCEKYPEVENEVYEKLEKVKIALDVK